MRTGGVDPGRIGKRKKSPKPKSKRPHGVSQSSSEAAPSQPTITETSELSAETSEAVTGDVSEQSENSTFEHVISERLATTPGCGLGAEQYDVEKAFKVLTRRIPMCFRFYLVV